MRMEYSHILVVERTFRKRGELMKDVRRGVNWLKVGAGRRPRC